MANGAFHTALSTKVTMWCGFHFPTCFHTMCMINFFNLIYYSAYFCYYLYISLYFLILFIGPTVLFQLTFTFIYDTFKKKNNFNKINKFQTDLTQTFNFKAIGFRWPLKHPAKVTKFSLKFPLSLSFFSIFLGGLIHVEEKEWKFFYIRVKNLKSCAWSSFLSIKKNSRHIHFFCCDTVKGAKWGPPRYKYLLRGCEIINYSQGEKKIKEIDLEKERKKE